MSVQYQLHCPYCGFLLSKTDTLAPHNGKLLATCPMCGELYADPYGKEIALEPDKPNTIPSLLKNSVLISATLALFMSLSVCWVTFDDSFFLPVLAGAFPVIWLPYLLISLLSRKSARKKYLTALHESDARLRDPSYALALKQMGYYIPVRYLPADVPQSDFCIRPVCISKDVPPQRPNGSEHY